MALLAFQETNVDIAVIETGLGGRLDATNVIQPILCVLTPISHDHCEHLGESLVRIATEKAGILKKKTPVVVGKQEPEVLGVIQKKADALESRVCLAGKDYSWQGSHDNLSIEIEGERLKALSCCLAGTHQLDNFSQAVATAVEIRHQGFSIPDDAIRKAGKEIFWPGRLEWLGNKQKVLLDVSHNQAGTRTLSDYLSENNFENIQLVVGMSGDRKPKDILNPLKPLVAKVFAVPVPHSSGVSTRLIADWAKQVGLPCEEFGSAEAGLHTALRSSGDNENVVVCGSIYLVAELRDKLLQETYHSLIG